MRPGAVDELDGVGGVDVVAGPADAVAAFDREMKRPFESETVEAVQRRGSGAGCPAGHVDGGDQRTKLGKWSNREAARDSATKLDVELTCRNRLAAGLIGHSSESSASGPPTQPQ